MNNCPPARAARAALILCTLAASAPAAAYVGPGAGLSLLGALWAVVVTIAAALFFLLMWPLRRALRRRANDRAKVSASSAGPVPAPRAPLSPKH